MAHFTRSRDVRRLGRCSQLAQAVSFAVVVTSATTVGTSTLDQNIPLALAVGGQRTSALTSVAQAALGQRFGLDLMREEKTAAAVAASSFPELVHGVDIDAALAGKEAKRAWDAVVQIQSNAKTNLATSSQLAQAAIAVAKSAAKAAKKQDVEVTALVQQTRQQARDTARNAAIAYLAQVQQAASSALAAKAAAEAARQQIAADSAGSLAVAVAAPYRVQMLRGSGLAEEYNRRARALAVASNRLKADGADLAGRASSFQAVGRVAEAKRMMVTATSLVKQAEGMQGQAESFQAYASQASAALPAFRTAAQAASMNAEFLRSYEPVAQR
eukprot:TRINITY_DN68204_c0_g1_i1.p1 TRINITY_DN68204_c0_g1~~TRINITY_DN68204_c0_g1_i1.p1  ORF type:complete len:329 (+),score=60.40 TRINITY_DN68204_c0_g1_i1:63-1049(+)